MTIATLMIHMRVGLPNDGLLNHAVDLARRFDADVIGVAVCEMMQPSSGYGEAYISGEAIDASRASMRAGIATAEHEFRAAFANQPANIAWRSDLLFTSAAEYLAQQARSADLMVTVPETRSLFTGDSRTSIGELLMQLGRPMLVVPTKDRMPRFDRIIIAWKDTGEARRATSDAMPFLSRAKSVTVVEIAAAGELETARAGVDDVAHWLSRHGVTAHAMPLPGEGDDGARLKTIAAELDVDVVVAGAYGHSRLREWIFGGVTRDLLMRDDHCALLSH